MDYQEKQYRQRIALGQKDNALILLIAICLIFFVGLAFMKAVWYFRYQKDLALPLFNKNILGWLVMPADTGKLAAKPWTVITHMFVHDNIWKVFANMLWLWCFGYILQDMTGNRKIFPVFFYGAIGGALAFILAYSFIPSLAAQRENATAIGASAGVMSVAIVTTLVSPGYRLFPLVGGGIPLWVLTAIYAISSLATISFSDTANILLTLAGALTGFLFIFFYRRGYDWSGWMNRFFDWVGNLFDPRASTPRPVKNELFYNATTAPFTKTPHLTQQRIDEILDKITREGFDHLTEEEKELLKRASREDI